MFRTSTSRLPVALAATGILLCGCTSAVSALNTPATPSTVPAATGSATADAAAAPIRTATPAPPATPAAAPSSAAPAPLPEMTASTWAEELAGGSLSPSAAATRLTTVPTPATVAPAPAPHSPTQAAKPRTKVVYLTFDDGPSSKYTPEVLALLDAYQAKATFFVIGKQVEGAARTLRAEYAAGHGIGNHTWNHRNLRTASAKQFKAQVGGTQRAVKKAIGHAPTCLRPPMGMVGKNTKKRAAAYGLKLKLWSIDTYDWKLPGAKTIARRAKTARDGSVVLMHDGGGNRKQTVAALRVILKDLTAEGFVFKAMCR